MEPVLLVVATEAADIDDLSAILWAHSPTAVMEREAPDGPVLVAGFPSVGAARAAEADLDYRFTAEILRVDDDAWLDAWRKHARVHRAGDRLVIVPPWLEHDTAPGEVVVSVDPGRSFGSGSHPSTRLALALLEGHLRPGDRVLDIGCGSGVLAVAAARLGAATVVALDDDPEAVAATRANATRNGVTVDVRAGRWPGAGPTGPFDLVTANLSAAGLAEGAGAITAALAPGGTAVLAGLLADQAEAVAGPFAALVPAGALTEEAWIALALRRPGEGVTP